MRALSVAAEFQGRRLSDDESRALNAALRYFREAAPKHNADEEESLFPRLCSLPDIEVQRALADIDRLKQEHRWATPLHMEVDRLGGKWLADGELEDSVLFPLARRILSPAHATEIAGEMAKRLIAGLDFPLKRIVVCQRVSAAHIKGRVGYVDGRYEIRYNIGGCDLVIAIGRPEDVSEV